MIETERLTIRRVREDDWRAIRDIWIAQKATPYARFDSPNDTSDDAVRERIARWAAFSKSVEHMFFAVCSGGVVVGYAAFNARPYGYEIGYCFHAAHHGHGYARESISVLMDYLKGMGVKRIAARTALENGPSVRLLERLGFVQTGRESVSFYKDAAGRDIYFTGGIFEREL